MANGYVERCPYVGVLEAFVVKLIDKNPNMSNHCLYSPRRTQWNDCRYCCNWHIIELIVDKSARGLYLLRLIARTGRLWQE